MAENKAFDDYFAAHENLARLAVTAADGGDTQVLEEIVAKADNQALLLNLAIAVAQEQTMEQADRRGQ